MAAPTPPKNTALKPTVKAAKTNRKRRKQRKVVCLICHQAFAELTAEHLRSHGFTMTRYRRAYGASTRPPAGSSPQLQDPQRLTALDLAERIVSDPDVIRELAGEVAEAIFSTSLRDKLRLSLVSLLAQRLEAHGKAAAALDQVRSELSEPWRIEQGGENGKPTPTKVLVQMHQALAMEVKHSEDLLTKTVKMAVDEYRSHKGDVHLNGGLDPQRFQGSAEVLPIPPSLTPGDRETIRTLYQMLDRTMTVRRAMDESVDAEHSPSTPAGPLPTAESAAEEIPSAGRLPDDEHSNSAAPPAGDGTAAGEQGLGDGPEADRPADDPVPPFTDEDEPF